MASTSLMNTKPCRDRDAASFDAAMIGVDRRMFRRGLGQRIVEEHGDIGVQRAFSDI
jgi:hypothetical protein